MTVTGAAAVGLQVSVVIPTYRRPELLQRCLAALARQTLSPHNYEILVVDDERSDHTRVLVGALAAHWNDRPALAYLRPSDGRGPANARNVGWRAAVARLVAFTDDDTEPDADWLRQGVLAMGRSDAAAVCGRLDVPVSGRPTDHARMTQGLASAAFVTANVFVRQAALRHVGGFDPRYTRAWREDSDLQFSLLRAGYTVGRAPAAVVVHPVRPAPWGISLRQQANSAFDALLYKKHRAFYRQMGDAAPPWHYHGIVLSTVAALWAAGAGAVGVAAAFALATLSALLAFALYRLRGASLAPGHVAEMVVTSFAIPYLSVYWRLVGALRYRVLFL